MNGSLMAENETQGLFNTKEGLLAKTGSNNRGWKDRYFRLADGKLAYYKSEKDDSSLGYIDLRDCIKVTRSHVKKGYGFDIHVPGRIYNLSARTQDLLDEWTVAVDVSIAIIRSVYGDVDRRSESVLGRMRYRNDSLCSVDQDQGSLTSIENLSNRKSEPDLHSLLEAEVRALNTKSSQLEEDLRHTQSQRDQLHGKFQDMKTNHEETVKLYGEEVAQLKNQIQSLEKAKSSLEAVNDSLQVQVQEREESMTNLEQQLTEEIRELEDETRNLQDDLERLKEKQLEVEEEKQSVTTSNSELQRKVRKMQIDFEEERKELKIENTKLLERLECIKKEVESEKEIHNNEKTQRQRAEEQLKQSMEVWQKLEVTERERDRLKALLGSLQQNHQSNSASTIEELRAERLQLQAELENLRSSMSSELEFVRGANERERRVLEERLDAAEQENRGVAKSMETKELELGGANKLITELKGRVLSLEDSNKLLQIEKEKAMSDLITMKKNMKEKERRSNSDEESTSPVNSISRDAKLLEAENRAEMATRLLREIQAERDLLKAQLKRQGSPKPLMNETTVPVDNATNSLLRIPSDLKSKSRATTAISNLGDLPPPKPKLPPKDVLDKIVV